MITNWKKNDSGNYKGYIIFLEDKPENFVDIETSWYNYFLSFIY